MYIVRDISLPKKKQHIASITPADTTATDNYERWQTFCALLWMNGEFDYIIFVALDFHRIVKVGAPARFQIISVRNTAYISSLQHGFLWRASPRQIWWLPADEWETWERNVPPKRPSWLSETSEGNDSTLIIMKSILNGHTHSLAHKRSSNIRTSSKRFMSCTMLW